MSRPLYRHALKEPKLQPGGHAGLWYDKFGDGWTLSPERPEFDKAAWIQALTAHPAGQDALIREMALRQADLVLRHGGHVLRLRNEGPFATGLGRSHPVENGMAWHPTLGTPYLPGSGLKGLVRTWAGQWLESDAATLQRVFGSGGDDPTQVGSVVFCDVLPTIAVRLCADVMTPHYNDWYQQTDSRLPGDFISPVPIPFLSVAADNGFQAAILPRTPDAVGDASLVARWLEDALLELGAGAKTASGYGRFIPDTAGQEDLRRRLADRSKAMEQAKLQAAAEAERAKRLANASEVRRQIEDYGYSSPNPQDFTQKGMNVWLDQMESADRPIEQRREIAELLRDWYRDRLAADWQKYSATRAKPTGKDKQEKRIHRICQALDL